MADVGPNPNSPAARFAYTKWQMEQQGYILQPANDGSYVAYLTDGSGKPVEGPFRVVQGADGGLSIDTSFKGIGASAGGSGGGGRLSPSVVQGGGGNTFVFDPNTGGWTQGPNVGVDPQYTSITDERTGRTRLVDLRNPTSQVDLGQTGFAGVDPANVESQRRLEADRLFAYNQARDAMASAQNERQFQASMDMQNKQMQLSAIGNLQSLSDAKEERRRQILQGASDFVYRAFTQRGEQAPEKMVTHADLINAAAAEFDKIASLYQQVLAPKQYSSITPQSQSFQSSLPVATGAGAGSPPPASAPATSAPSTPGGVPNYGPLPGGGYGLLGYNQPTSGSAAPANAASGSGVSAPRLTPPTPAEPAADPSIDWSQPAHPSPYVAPPSLYDWSNAPNPDYAAIEPMSPEARAGGRNISLGDMYDWGSKYLWPGLSGRAKGGLVMPGEPVVVGEDGYEVMWTNPDGTANVMPNRLAKKVVEKNGRLRGFEDGTFFGGWNGQDATAAIAAFNAAQAASSAPQAAPSAPAQGGGAGGGAYYATPGGPNTVGLPGYGGGAGTPGWVPQGWSYSPQTGMAADASGNAYQENAFMNGAGGYNQTPWAGQPGGGGMGGGAGLGGGDPISALLAALRPKTTTQDQILADELRMRPPAVNSILTGQEVAPLNIGGGPGAGGPQVASRLALSKLTPDELTALNTSLGVAYNTTLDDYLAASDARYLAGAGSRRARLAYR